MEAAGHWSRCRCVAGAGCGVREFGAAGGCIVLGSDAPIWCALAGHAVQHRVQIGKYRPGRGSRRFLPRASWGLRRDAVLTATGTRHAEPPVVFDAARNAQIFATEFLPGSTSYLIGPRSATCQGYLASADGGEIMTATSAPDRSQSVTMIIRPGGAGPSTDLACPYIPAVLAADKVFRQNLGHVFCHHPTADVIRQIPTHTPSLYAAAVLVPARVKDPNIQGSGDDPGPTVALYTAEVGQGAANGQMAACTLAPGQADICAASLKFFLITQAQISAQISTANLSRMENALSSLLAEQNI